MSSKGTEPVSILKISIAFESRKPELSIFVTMASDTRDDEHTGEQPPRRRSRSHAPHHIDLSLAQSQASANGGFQVHTPKRTVWESVFVTDLPVKEATKLTHESYRKAQSAMAILCKIRVQNNKSHSRNGEDLPEAPDYLSHHEFNKAYTWMLWEQEAQRNFMGVRIYLSTHPEKKKELWNTTHIAKRYWREHVDDFAHYFPPTPDLAMETSSCSSFEISSLRTSRGSQISGEDAVLTDPAIVLIKFK
jgi:hypothetical protein